MLKYEDLEIGKYYILNEEHVHDPNDRTVYPKAFPHMKVTLNRRESVLYNGQAHKLINKKVTLYKDGGEMNGCWFDCWKPDKTLGTKWWPHGEIVCEYALREATAEEIAPVRLKEMLLLSVQKNKELRKQDNMLKNINSMMFYRMKIHV